MDSTISNSITEIAKQSQGDRAILLSLVAVIGISILIAGIRLIYASYVKHHSNSRQSQYTHEEKSEELSANKELQVLEKIITSTKDIEDIRTMIKIIRELMDNLDGKLDRLDGKFDNQEKIFFDFRLEIGKILAVMSKHPLEETSKEEKENLTQSVEEILQKWG